MDLDLSIEDELSSGEVADAVGMTYRQLGWLVRNNVITPKVLTFGTGTAWRWDPEQLRVLRLIAVLRELGASLETLRRLVPLAESLDPRVWETRVLFTLDGRITTLLGADVNGYMIDLAHCRDDVRISHTPVAA